MSSLRQNHRNIARLTLFLFVIGVFSLVFATESTVGQTTKQLKSHECIEFRVISQNYYDSSKGKRAPDYIDLTPDDVLAVFRVTNSCSVPVFILKDEVSKSWVGFMLYNRDGKGWTSFSPGWGRERIFTGVGYYWDEIKPGQKADFEATHLSTVPGKRSFAAYFNYKPIQDGRLEINAEEYCTPILVYKK